MKIIISPAKTFKIRKMRNMHTNCLFEDKKNQLVLMMKTKSVEELKMIWKCSDKIANDSYNLYQKFDSSVKGSAIESFYGILRPLDQVARYRLDFEDKIINMYDFWEDEIRNYFKGEKIIDLASKEYGQNIYKYLDIKPLRIEFKEETLKDGCIKLKTKATSSKILRGRMVNYMAKNDIVEINEL
ncbi:MAG: YaaA family protein, partial [Finegoldia magna]|nr:YaaA family protein [Finegoldia magna]